MSDMNIAIRVGRAVVQNKKRLTGGLRPDALIHAIALPLGHPGRLAFCQITAHGEICFGQIY
jgi:hypothetical protein